MNRSNRPTARFGRAAVASIAIALGLALAPAHASAAAATEHAAEVVLRALSLLGVDYRWGGNTPETGLDCSGLVRLVFHEAVGLPLPRRSEEISRVGDAVRRSELQPGDLVFFNTLRRSFSHVGIYIGHNQFVHAPAAGGQVRVEALNQSYWTRRFNGARRLIATDFAAGSVVARADWAASARPATQPQPVNAVARAALPAAPASAVRPSAPRAAGLDTARSPAAQPAQALRAISPLVVSEYNVH